MNKKGFTLIELLAVIIILGVLMIIAIPSVTKYIDDSRKNGYVSTAKELAGGARNLIYSGDLSLDDFDTTYYIDANCISTDNAYKSPYGDFVKAYVVVTANNDNYEYYWTSVDDAGRGVKGLINVNKLDSNNIETGISSTDITTDRGLDNREYVVLVNEACQKGTRVARTGANINGLTGEEIKNLVCKKATTLHTKTCNKESGGCSSTIGNGNPITFGTIPNGTPKAGDAYDCDVNNDKVFDSQTERFYYVGSNGNNSVLIYYRDMNNSLYAYDASGQNWHGPRTGYQYLPDATTWSNPGLIAPGTRSIVAENGNGSTSGGTIENFTYEGKAARFLTTQEVNSACGIIVGNYIQGELNECIWLIENTIFDGDSGTSSYGYWLETPLSSDTYSAWIVGASRHVYNYNVTFTTSYGVRPVITVPTSYLE